MRQCARPGVAKTWHSPVGISLTGSCHIEPSISLCLALTCTHASLLPGTTKPPFAMLRPSALNLVCPKCSFSKKSGKLSCCARGGAWFQECGDAGDSKFGHTWFEGMQACKSMFPRVCVARYMCWKVLCRLILSMLRAVFLHVV